MTVLQPRPVFTLEERAARHRLRVRDTVALSSLFTIVLALTFVTYLLFHSFAAHRASLQQRWRGRGEAALRNGQPQTAIESLRSALAYAPDDRGLQVELATALAAAGRIQEAMVYFNTLHESQPGDGMINLQLARLAIREGNVPGAIESYQAALDGTWNGDGVVRRRQARLELARYLIAQRRFDEARNQLLIAAGNAADNHSLQLTVAGLLEQADGDPDAFNLYRKALAFRETRTAALVGAGRTAAAQNRYMVSRNLLEQALLQPDFARLPVDERDAVHGLFDQANRLLVLFPSETLLPHQRAVRVAHDAQLAHTRLSACAPPSMQGGSAKAPLAIASNAASASGNPTLPVSAAHGMAQDSTVAREAPAPTPTPAAPTQPDRASAQAGALQSALGAVERARESLTRTPAAPSPPGAAEATGAAESTLAALITRWQQLPSGPALERQMERDPALLQTTLQLTYDTEKSAAQLCGAPTGEDALLLKIAAAPEEIEQP